MNESAPRIRNDLEFIPIQHEGRQLVLIRDHLGLVQEGKAVAPALYQILALLNGVRSVRDIQWELMRQRGGVLVNTDEIKDILVQLDKSFLLDSERFQSARNKIVTRFASEPVRRCSHCGQGYPNDPIALRAQIDEILDSRAPASKPDGKILALVAPHIDLRVGYKVYSRSYSMLKYASPMKVILIGVGHQMADNLFSLTEKDFETPLGLVKSAPGSIKRLREKGQGAVSDNDFAHRSEHSIEFQILFLQHILKQDIEIIPILCGSFQASLSEYSRSAYLEKAGPFLETLREIVLEPETLLVAGVDFSHIGPKFGHDRPAEYLEGQSVAHDKRLLESLSRLDKEKFWEESREINDRFNVCGFSALASLLEVLPSCKGEILDYQTWHEEATKSAVSFAAAVFTSPTSSL
jgi:AmmeMemoRadiSam system protein B